MFFPRSKKKAKQVEEMQKERDSLDFDDDMSSMSIFSGYDPRRKSIENDSVKTSLRKNKVYQHIKKEMEIRAKFKPVTNAGEQVCIL